MTQEIYISIDIEADGPCPGLHSMLSIAAVAINPQLENPEIGHWYANLELLEGADSDPGTDAWWAKQPHAYAETRKLIIHPKDAMESLRDWLRTLPGKKICIAYPAGFDFTFLYYYCHRFLGECPLGFSALDIKTYGACVLSLDYSQATKKQFPKEWFDKSKPHTHVALDDAREQAYLFCKMLDARDRIELTQRRYRDDAIEEAIQRLSDLRGK